MEAAEYPIILNIYELIPPTGNDNSESNANNNTAATTVSFFSRLLKPIGFGTYHTSLSVNGYCYTFSPVVGIQKSSITNRAPHLHVPPNGRFQESIKIGTLSDSMMDQNKINECINRLRRSYFTDKSYHLACRNCNHFTETFATALLLADYQYLEEEGEGADKKKKNGPSLDAYPSWVNRLAKSGSRLIDHDDVCDVMKEARDAAGVEGKVGWSFNSSFAKSSSSSSKGNNDEDRKKKKSLTEAQKKALAKLRKK